MWKQFIDFGSRLFTLSQRAQKQEEISKELRQEIKEVNDKLDLLSDFVHRLALKFEHDRENAERDREIQRLRLENFLLRFERGLPPVIGTKRPREAQDSEGDDGEAGSGLRGMAWLMVESKGGI